MKKSKLFFIIIIIVAMTSFLTFTITNIVQIKNDSKILIPIETYENLKHIELKYEKAERLEKFISENFYEDISDEVIEDGVLYGLFDSLDDPYSVYMNQKEFKEFNDESNGTYGGIGIIVTASKGDFITIVSPIEDTPGERAGLKSGDKIIEANGIQVFSSEIDKAIDIMKGEPNTEVKLKIKRDEEIFDVNITRELIVLKSVKSRIINDKYGYIRITMFDSKVSEEFEKNLQELLNQNIEGLVIDLRSNPGGSLYEVIKVADRLLGEQMIVYTENRAGHKEEYVSDSKKLNLPMTVLVNEGSASASEILTASIQDTDSGIIIGTTTFGKGIVQSVIPLYDGSGIKLTTSQYFTPNGECIHGIGIEPDVVIELPDEYYEIEDPTDEDDIQLQKAIEILKEK
ncbi:S41 family peptidase [Clostridiaceae bacterium HSG29]|nr:S41 family peptidase [Clostridiaceae bacterium HSG29]